MMAVRRLRGRPLLHLPFMADIARDSSRFVVIEKAAQAGVSELQTNLALWATATGFAGRGHVLFLQPTQALMDVFTQTRIDPAIQDSPQIRQLLQPEPPRRRGVDSLRVKRIADGSLSLRGSESRRQLTSFDADWVFLDEADQMPEETYELARRRLRSSRDGRLWAVSTPSFAEAGINAHYRQSDQRRYHLPCPSCGLKQPLTWPENIDFERALRVCRECRAELDVLAAGAWVPEAPGNTRIRGYHIPGLLSPWANIPNMIEASEAMTPVARQQFYNADLGETFSPPGGGLSPDELDHCRRPYALDDYRGQRCDMGVDVGLTLHVVIREHSDEPSQPRRLWFAGQVGWEDLDGLMERFNAPRIVIDAQPEAYMAGTFALRHRSQTWLAYYGRREVGIDWRKGETGKPHTVHLNRTEMLDAVMAHFRDQSLPIPRDARRLGARFRSPDGFAEYYRELLAPKRVMEHDANGNLAARWDDRGRDDHNAHAEAYCFAASQSPIGARPGRIRSVDTNPFRSRPAGWT